MIIYDTIECFVLEISKMRPNVIETVNVENGRKCSIDGLTGFKLGNHWQCGEQKTSHPENIHSNSQLFIEKPSWNWNRTDFQTETTVRLKYCSVKSRWWIWIYRLATIKPRVRNFTKFELFVERIFAFHTADCSYSFIWKSFFLYSEKWCKFQNVPLKQQNRSHVCRTL